MNFLIFAYGLICLSLTVNGQLSDGHSGVREKCFKEMGLAKEELSASGSSTFLQNPKSKCYLKCFIEELSLFNQDHSIDIERSVHLTYENIREQARPLITKCINENVNIADKCEKSFAAVKCLYEANADIFQQLGILEPPKKS